MPKEVTGEVFAEIGSTGLKRSGGFIDQEWLRQLATPTLRYRAFSEMRDNDATIGAILYAIETLIRQVEWTVTPAHDSDLAREAAKFVEECLLDMTPNWETFLSEVLSMLPYGFSMFEVVYKVRGGEEQEDERFRSRYDDGRIGWRKLAVRGQDTIERWKFTTEGDIDGFYQVAPPDYSETFVPMSKCLLFRTKVERNNPEGRSLLRNGYRSWYFLKRLQEIEAIGVERDLAGLPVMHVPVEVMSPNATAAQKSLRSSLETVIQQIRRDEREGVVMPAELDRDGKPTGYKLSLLSTGGSRAMNTDEIIRRYESRIAMSVLAEFIMLGMDKTGSFALADSKTDLFATSLRTILQTIASVFNAEAIAHLFHLNPEFPEHCWPSLTFGDIESQDLDKLGKYLQAIASAGLITPDATLEDTLREAADLPVVAANGTAMHDDESHLYDGTASPYGDENIEPSTMRSEPDEPEPIKLDASMVKIMLDVMREVKAGTITRRAAEGMLRTAIPGIDQTALAEMFDESEV
jgi:hypothetical protein